MAGARRKNMILSSFSLPTDFEDRLRSHPIFEIENIYRAYLNCRKRKRNTVNAMRFEINMEENILNLRKELISGSYTPGRSIAFLVEKPKKREIFAADFRDRIVHHLLVEHLEKYWEKRFISDSYSCRRQKGTHAAVDKLHSYMMKSSFNNTQNSWYLQLDIKGYFTTMNKNVLFDILSAKESDPVILWLTHKILSGSPVDNCLLRGASLNDFMVLPDHKTLFKTNPDCGLPIGNLTSQFFANVYLDILDQYVKHDLKCKHYLRYCDDFILLSNRRDYLETCEVSISEFLRKRLQLDLNPKRKLAKISSGVNFLGYIIKPKYRLVRKRVIGNLYDKLYYAEEQLINEGLNLSSSSYSLFPWNPSLIEKLFQQLNSYLAHFNKASNYKIICRLLEKFRWLTEYFSFFQGISRKIINISLILPKQPLFDRYFQQVKWFGNILQSVFFVQIGSFWDIWDSTKSGILTHLLKVDNASKSDMIHFMQQKRARIAIITETGDDSVKIKSRNLAFRMSPNIINI